MNWYRVVGKTPLCPYIRPLIQKHFTPALLGIGIEKGVGGGVGDRQE